MLIAIESTHVLDVLASTAVALAAAAVLSLVAVLIAARYARSPNGRRIAADLLGRFHRREAGRRAGERRQHPVAGPAIVAVAVIAIIASAELITRIPPIAPRAIAPSTSASSTPPRSPVCAIGSLQLIGSADFMAIAQNAADSYMYDCPGARITVSGEDGAYALTKVRQAEASRSPSAGSLIGMYDGLAPAAATSGLISHPVGVLIFSVVAHTGLIPASNITATELRKLFLEPGEQDKVAVGRPAGSEIREAFIANVLGSDPGPPGNSCPAPSREFPLSCTVDSTVALLNVVNSTPDAIGYAAVSQSDTAYPHVSVIDINGSAPTADNIRKGLYKFWVVENLYTAEQPAPLTVDFLDFLPHYLDSNPLRGFIACSALKNLDAC